MIIEITLLIIVIATIVFWVKKPAAKSKNDDVLKRTIDRAEEKKANDKRPCDSRKKVKPSEEHRYLINKPYSIQCKSDIFSKAELEIINKYGSWLSALASNQIDPETEEQKRFIEECKNFRALEITEMLSYFSDCSDRGSIQTVWFKYLCRIKLERKNPNILHEKNKIDWGLQGPL